MTIEEAIEKFKREKKTFEDNGVFYGTSAEHIDLAIVALKKQIPTSPIIKSWNPALCPNCKAELSESLGDGYYKHHTNLKYCNCGQKLKWE